MKGNHSKRIVKLEREMFELRVKENKPIALNALKDKFYKRASLATTKSIIDVSPRLTLNGLDVDFAPYVYADITYTIVGGAVSGIFIDGQSGNIVGDTLYGVRLFGANHEFELRITQNRVANWIFDATSIKVVAGGNRKLINPVSDSITQFIDSISTI